MTDLILPSRRGFITGLASLIASPAIVRVGSLMSVRALPVISMRGITDYVSSGDPIRLDVLYGQLTFRSEWLLTSRCSEWLWPLGLTTAIRNKND